MPTVEIASRLQGISRRWQDRLEMARPRTQRACDFQSVSEACAKIVPGLDRAEISLLAREFPDSHSALSNSVSAAAKQVMQGRIDLLGHSVEIANPDWHRDPLSDFRWPRKFYGDVQIYEMPADVKYVWEISRHQFFPTLAQAWLIHENEACAIRAQELIADWIENNPLYLGVNWTSGLEVALRANSWIWMIAGLQSWTGWTKKITEQISRSLADHAHYLFHHLSYYSSPYNHLVGEASALYALSLVLADHSDATKWRNRGREVLIKYGPGQFYDDGFTVEQATGYHFFTLGFFIQALTAGRNLDTPLVELETPIENAALAGAILSSPDGRWPMIGDLDSARSIPCGHTDFWDFRGLCGLAGSLFENESLAAPFQGSDSESFWLLGTEGVRWLKSCRSNERRAGGILPDAGYACWSNDHGDWVTLDCGPIGDGVHEDETASVAHGHDDALSVHLMFKNRNILTDSGMLRYAGSRDWVDYMRSESAHNRIVVEGLSGAKNAGRLAWSHVRQKTELSARLSPSAGFFHAKLKLGTSVTIDRHLFITAEAGLWIVDFVSLDRPRSVKWNWHMPLDTSLSLESGSVLSGDSFKLRSWCSEEFENGLIESRENQPEAWIAPGYGKKNRGILAQQRVVSQSNALLMVTHLGEPKVRAKVGFGDTNCIELNSTTDRLPVPSNTESLRWEMLAPVAASYVVGHGPQSGIECPVPGLGHLNVYQSV